MYLTGERRLHICLLQSAPINGIGDMERDVKLKTHRESHFEAFHLKLYSPIKLHRSSIYGFILSHTIYNDFDAVLFLINSSKRPTKWYSEQVYDSYLN